MAATAVTVHALDHKTPLAKPDPDACDNVNGNSAINGGTLILELTSTEGGTVTVSFPASSNVDGQAPEALTYTFTGAQTQLVGGFPVAYYGSEVSFTASANTITVIAYQL